MLLLAVLTALTVPSHAAENACQSVYEPTHPLSQMNTNPWFCSDECQEDAECVSDNGYRSTCTTQPCPLINKIGIDIQMKICSPARIPTQAELKSALRDCAQKVESEYESKIKNKKLAFSTELRRMPEVAYHVNETVAFTAASTPKIGILYTAYSLLHKLRQSQLTQKEIQAKYPGVFEFGLNLKQLDFNSEFKTLLHESCQASSNSASNTLINLLGRDTIQKALNEKRYFDPVKKQGLWLGGYFGAAFDPVGPADRQRPLGTARHPDPLNQYSNSTDSKSLLAIASDISHSSSLPKDLAGRLVADCVANLQGTPAADYLDSAGYTGLNKVGFLQDGNWHLVFHKVQVSSHHAVAMTCEREPSDTEDCQSIWARILNELDSCVHSPPLDYARVR